MSCGMTATCNTILDISFFSAHHTKRCTLSKPTKCYMSCNEYWSFRVAPVPGACALPDDTSSTQLPGVVNQGLPRGLRIRTITFATSKINFAMCSACLTMVDNLYIYPTATIPCSKSHCRSFREALNVSSTASTSMTMPAVLMCCADSELTHLLRHAQIRHCIQMTHQKLAALCSLANCLGLSMLTCVLLMCRCKCSRFLLRAFPQF